MVLTDKAPLSCATSTAALTDAEFIYYSRQLLLPDWSETTQLLLKQKKLLVIGLGGLGCPAATYLAGSGIGQIWLCDADKVERSNLPRQPLYRPNDIGLYKADAAQKALQAYNPYIRLTAINQYADEALLHQMLPDVDFVLDCSDNQHTKLLLNRLCRQYQTAWAGASVVAYQGYSWLMPPALPLELSDDTAQNLRPSNQHGCLQCLGHDAPLTAGGCASQGVFAPLVAMLAMQLCSAALHYFAQRQQRGWFMLYQQQSQTFLPLTITPDPDCPVCRDVTKSPANTQNAAQTCTQSHPSMADVTRRK